MADEGITDLSPEGEKLPEVVDVKRVEKKGYSEETRTYADGTYAQFTLMGDRYIEIARRFPDGEIVWYRDLPNGKYLKIGEEFPDGTKRRWNTNGKRYFVKLPDGTERWWDPITGVKTSEKLPDGTEIAWSEGGNIACVKMANGTKCRWDENGQMIELNFAISGTYRSWYDNGQMKEEKLFDGTYRSWYDNGQTKEEKLSDGTYRSWYDNRQTKEEKLSDGTTRSWYDNGQMKEETRPDGTYRSWYEDGQLFNEELPDGKKTHFCSRAQELSVTYPNGKVLIYGKDYTMMNDGERTFVLNETLPDGSKITYFPRGKTFPRRKTIAYKSLPDGTKYGYYRNGNLKYEITSKYKLYVLRDGTKKYKLPDGKEIAIKTDKSGRVVYHSVNGVEDTKEYLARRILAAKKMYFNSLRKSKGTVVNSDGSTRERTVAPKMSPLCKAVGMLWARRKLAKQM